MKLIIFNGSPRGKKSNSNRITSWITDSSIEDVCYLNNQSAQETYIKKAKSADVFLFIFPLYVDSMPAITKLFFEMMEKNKETFAGKPVYFVIHSGFPEMIQCRTLSHYLNYFSRKIMEMDYKGTVIFAGSESLQMAPDGAFRRLRSALQILKKSIQNNESIPEDLNIKINKRDRLTPLQKFLFTINPLKNFYWNYRAKQHGQKIDLTDQPYA